MGILENYRRRRPRGIRGYRSAVLLAVLLVIVVAGGYAFRARFQRRPVGLPLRAPAAVESPPALAPAAVDSDAAAKWTPLSPEKEDELLGEVVDQRPLYLREHRDAYYYLLGKVRSMSDDDLREAIDPTITYSDYGRQPAIIRGTVVEATGRLLWLTRTELDAKVAPLTHVYEGQILDPDMRIYWFVLTETPGDPFVPGLVTLKQGLRARLRGIFMQVVVYRTRAGKDMAVPFLIGRRLESRQGLRSGVGMPSWPWLAGIAAAAVLLILAFVFASLRRPTPIPLRASDEGIEEAAACLEADAGAEDAAPADSDLE